MANSVKLYTIAFEKDEKPISNISILDFFKKLELFLETNERVKTIFGKTLICSRFQKDNKNDERIIISFGKLKEGLSFKFNTSMIFEEINMDIFNINSFEYDDIEKILAITTNGTGPGSKYIENYLNSFLPENYPYIIKIRPLLENKGLDILKKANFIRAVEFKLNLNYDFSNINFSSEKGVFKGLLELALNTQQKLGSKTLTFSIAVGDSKRDSSLIVDNVIEILDSIELNESFIKEIYVVYKNNEKEKSNISKLKEYLMMIEYHFSIDTTLISSEYLRDNWDDMLNNVKSRYFKSKRDYFNKNLICENSNYELVIRKGAD